MRRKGDYKLYSGIQIIRAIRYHNTHYKGRIKESGDFYDYENMRWTGDIARGVL